MGGHRIKWKPEIIAVLGKLTDRDVAKLVGTDPGGVCRKRRKLGIAPYKDRVRNRVWNSDEIKILGKIRDVDVAALMRISVTSVSAKRRALGIPALYPNTGPRGPRKQK